MVRNSFLTIFAVLLATNLAGCAALGRLFQSEPRVEIQTKYIKPDIPLIPKPQGVDLKDISWFVVTADNFSAFQQKIEKESGTLVFFAISVSDYERLALNMADIKRYIEQQKSIIVYYENAVTNSGDSSVIHSTTTTK